MTTARDRAREEYRAAAEEEAKARARAEIVRRSNTPEFIDAVEAHIIAGLHAAQQRIVALVFAFTRYIAAECSRRAGKTHLAAALIVLKLLRAKRGQEVVFCAPTLARGKELIWSELTRMLDDYCLDDWKRTEASGKIRTRNGAIFRIVGLDNKRQIGKISRGGNTILFITDETQEFPQFMEKLLIAAGPALAQSRGCFLAMGTPTSNDSDYWASICDGIGGFQHVHWTMDDNPFLGRPASEIRAEERERNGWSETHPTYVREYLGRRCKDASNLVLEYEENKNDTYAIENFSLLAYVFDEKKRTRINLDGYRYEAWRFFLGIDFGFRDTTAWVVLAAPAFGREVYVVHCECESNLDWDEVAERTERLCHIFQPQAVVGDSSTGGANFIKTFNRRYGSKFKVRARVAKKHDKPAMIAVLNTELRTRRMKLLRPVVDQLRKEATALQWEEGTNRTKILEGSAYPEDLFDAWRYGFNEFYAFLHGEAPKEETDEERRIRERNEREAARQAKAARGRRG